MENWPRFFNHCRNIHHITPGGPAWSAATECDLDSRQGSQEPTFWHAGSNSGTMGKSPR
jgi:hypothetical protein